MKKVIAITLLVLALVIDTISKGLKMLYGKKIKMRLAINRYYR